jgi:hypothetical protein
MDKFEPKETGLKRTVWLFEREILVNLEKTDLKDHYKVLSFNIFSMEYELNPEFDNGRADAIVMRDTANHWLKMWFVAFQTCASEKIQSRQAELDQAYEDIETFAQALQRECDIKVQIANESKEKDKRIKQALSELESLHNKKWAEWKEQADMHSQGEANAYEHAMQILEKVLRGEHE